MLTKSRKLLMITLTSKLSRDFRRYRSGVHATTIRPQIRTAQRRSTFDTEINMKRKIHLSACHRKISDCVGNVTRVHAVDPSSRLFVLVSTSSFIILLRLDIVDQESSSYLHLCFLHCSPLYARQSKPFRNEITPDCWSNPKHDDVCCEPRCIC